MMPTTLAITFNQVLDPATATDAKDYRIIGPAGRTIRVKKVTYDAQTDTVTLRPAQRISVHHPYKLIIRGTGSDGLENTDGQLLDGTSSGKPGSDFKTSLTWRDLVLDPPLRKPLHRPAAGKATVKIDRGRHPS